MPLAAHVVPPSPRIRDGNRLEVLSRRDHETLREHLKTMHAGLLGESGEENL